MVDEDDDLERLESTSPETWLERNWLILLISAGSIAWLCVTYLVVWGASPCDPNVGKPELTHIEAVLRRSLLCRPANEIGDFLAGAFSPLAFLWLFAAVVLQRNELSAQRKELLLSRGVSIAQTREARKNVRLLDEQTKLLVAQRQRAEREEADRDIQLLIDAFLKELSWFGDPSKQGIMITVDEREDGTPGTDFKFIGHFVGGGNDDITRHRNHIISVIQEFSNRKVKRKECIFSSGGWYYEYIEPFSKQILETSQSISNAKKIELDQLGLYSLIYRLDQVKDVLADISNEDDKAEGPARDGEAVVAFGDRT